MSTYGNRLNAALERKKRSRADLAKAIGRTPQAIGQVINGMTKALTAENNSLAAIYLDVNPHWLATGEGEMLPPTGQRQEASNVLPAQIGMRRVPLINYVQAGVWTEALEREAIGADFEYLLTDLELSASAFALEIKGDSMLPNFKPGDRVIIDPEICPNPGDFVVAKNGEEEATFKKYRPRGMTDRGNLIFELTPLNPDFAPIRSDQTPIRIVGTMVEHRQYRKRA